MLDVSYSGSTIVVLLSLPCTFLICYSFLLGYLLLSPLIAPFAILVPFRQSYAFLIVLLNKYISSDPLLFDSITCFVSYILSSLYLFSVLGVSLKL